MQIGHYYLLLGVFIWIPLQAQVAFKEIMVEGANKDNELLGIFIF